MANSDLTIQSSLTSLPKKLSEQSGVNGHNPAVFDQKLNEIEAKKAESEQNLDSAKVASDSLKDKVTQLNDHMQNLQRNLHFKVDEHSGETVVQVIDKETKEVVKQIPSEELLNTRHSMDEYQGLLLEVKA